MLLSLAPALAVSVLSVLVSVAAVAAGGCFAQLVLNGETRLVVLLEVLVTNALVSVIQTLDAGQQLEQLLLAVLVGMGLVVDVLLMAMVVLMIPMLMLVALLLVVLVVLVVSVMMMKRWDSSHLLSLLRVMCLLALTTMTATTTTAVTMPVMVVMAVMALAFRSMPSTLSSMVTATPTPAKIPLLTSSCGG